MGIGILIVVLSLIFVTWTFASSDACLAQQANSPTKSPLDEAERILAARYASGNISPDAYRRMLEILRT